MSLARIPMPTCEPLTRSHGKGGRKTHVLEICKHVSLQILSSSKLPGALPHDKNKAHVMFF